MQSKDSIISGTQTLKLNGGSVSINGGTVTIEGDVKVNGNSMIPGSIADSNAWQY